MKVKLILSISIMTINVKGVNTLLKTSNYHTGLKSKTQLLALTKDAHNKVAKSFSKLEKLCHTNTNHEEVRVDILILDKVDLREKNMNREIIL